MPPPPWNKYGGLFCCRHQIFPFPLQSMPGDIPGRHDIHALNKRTKIVKNNVPVDSESN